MMGSEAESHRRVGGGEGWSPSTQNILQQNVVRGGTPAGVRERSLPKKMGSRAEPRQVLGEEEPSYQNKILKHNGVGSGSVAGCRGVEPLPEKKFSNITESGWNLGEGMGCGAPPTIT